MYNLIVTSDSKAWTRSSYALEASRFGEYTPEPLKVRYGRLNEHTVGELLALPTVFAYERQHELPARVGRLSRIVEGSQGTLRIDFEISEDVAPIPVEKLDELAMEMDIVGFEMNRTHWAVKDVDLLEVLLKYGILSSGTDLSAASSVWVSSTAKPKQLSIAPTVFRIPREDQDPRLVALMIPFSPEFNRVTEAIRQACSELNLICERADDGWKESTIIQEVFNLIFRSSAVVVDLSGGNSNVMYETGIAHTLGRPVVPISQHDVRPPFDLSHHRVLFYLNNSEGLETMKRILKQRLLNIVPKV